MSVEVAEYDLVIYKGNDFSMTVSFLDALGDPLDLTGWTGYAQIREERSKSSTLIADFTVTHNGAGGVVTMTLADTDTNPSGNKGFYDLLMVDDDGFDETYLTGQVTFVPTVTDKS